MPISRRALKQIRAAAVRSYRRTWNYDLRRVLYKAQEGRCGICGADLTVVEATFDHIQPKSRGGEWHPLNLRLAHAHCNSLRGSPELPLDDEIALNKAIREERGGTWLDVGPWKMPAFPVRGDGNAVAQV